MKVSVIIGRFQVPTPHRGHEKLFRVATQESRNLIILVGSTGKNPSADNPLPFELRKAALIRRFNEKKIQFGTDINLTILPLPDRRSNLEWVQNIDNLLSAIHSRDEVTLFCGNHSGMKDAYKDNKGKFNLVEVDDEIGAKPGTDIRKNIGTMDISNLNTHSVIWATQNQYPKVFPTVDIAILDKGMVVLIRKKDESSWRFPGGFVDPKDASYEAAVRREASEECGDIELTEPEYVGSYKIDDWRYRGERDKIITSFFTCQKRFGHLKAGDDAFEIKLYQPEGAISEVVTEHRVLATALTEHMKKGRK